jgi:hypothetical protein
MPAAYDVSVVVARLERCSRRIWGATRRARELREVWTVLNEGRAVRMAISRSPASAAATILQDALLREQILIIVRLFDFPRGPALKSNRISFPVVRELLTLPGVMEVFTERARSWPGQSESKNMEIVHARFAGFEERLGRLQAEDPNRERRLRSYRDENLAHELYFEQPRPKALYGYIPDLLHEVLQLTEDVGLIVQGAHYFWDEGEAERSATALWSAVAAAFPRRNSLLRTE